MTVYLVRHAKAGKRGQWEGPDDLRPLSDAGPGQAEQLAEALRDEPVEHIVSSPHVRCRQTVEPLAGVLRLPVELSDALTEGASALESVRLVEKFGDSPAVLCTHGDVIEAVLEHLSAIGVDLGPEPRCEKGSTWVIDTAAGQPRRARYRPPPSS